MRSVTVLVVSVAFFSALCGSSAQNPGTGAASSCLSDPNVLARRVALANSECCNDKTEDCSSGAPATCDAGCAAVFLPFWRECGAALGSDWHRSAELTGVVAECEAATGQGSGSDAGPDPQCVQPYETLDDEWRRASEPGGNHCDRSPVYGFKDTTWFSPGARWFRFASGAALPTNPPGFQHCGTKTGGWLSGWDHSLGDPPVSTIVSC
jgi:hypothetical protein